MTSRVASRDVPSGLPLAHGPLRGVARVPADKSISHRAAIIGALADGEAVIRGYSGAGDCATTLRCLDALGVEVERRDGVVRVFARDGLRPPTAPVDCGRSGTTMRLLAGVLAGCSFSSVLTGEEQLLRRPMRRVGEPLRAMGARIEEEPDGAPPLRIAGGRLRGIDYALPVASAQVKSAVLLAGLRADGQTTVVEHVGTRDHTERLLAHAGASIDVERRDRGVSVKIERSVLVPFELAVPGDPSAAAFLGAAAAIVRGSDVTVGAVGVNPTRMAFFDLLERMGCSVTTEPTDEPGPEAVGAVRIRHGELRGVEVEPDEVPGLIDELPLVGLVASQADGTTIVRGAAELRVKESDRIAALVAGLRAVGVDIEEAEDGFIVQGPARLHGARCDARRDHRLAMTFALCGLVADGPVTVAGMDVVGDSFPGFVETLESLT